MNRSTKSVSNKISLELLKEIRQNTYVSRTGIDFDSGEIDQMIEIKIQKKIEKDNEEYERLLDLDLAA